MNYPGYITDRAKQLYLAGNDPDIGGAPYVYHTLAPQPVGVYIDDTTPNIRDWITKATIKYREQLVLVALAPGQRGLHYGPPPIVHLYEAYIYGMGVRWRAWLPLPKYEGYILQHKFPGIVDHQPPTKLQYLRLLALAKLRQPKYIFLY